MNAERITPIDINASQAVKYAGAILAERSEQARRLKYLGGGSFGRAVGVTLENGREYPSGVRWESRSKTAENTSSNCCSRPT